MRCSTTMTFDSGTVSRPPRSTRPLTLTRPGGCWTGAAASSVEKAPSARIKPLRRELPEIFRVEVLEVRLQGIGIELVATSAAPASRLNRPVGRVDRRELEQRLAGEDRRLQPQGESDGVGGTGV